MGSRLLRSSLFQPLSDIETLNARLDAVEQLLEQEEVFYGLCAVLPSMADLDQLVTHLCAFLFYSHTQSVSQFQ